MKGGITLRRLFSLLAMLCLVFTCAAAEIPCQCGHEKCVCFIQLGDEGPAVEFIQNTLITRGYLAANDDASAFDEKTAAAIRHFQQDNNIAPTGMMDDETLTLLLWSMLPEELDTAQPGSSTSTVWVPTDGGKRHHDKKTCSGMLDPRLVSQRNALAMNMLHCGRCKPQIGRAHV